MTNVLPGGGRSSSSLSFLSTLTSLVVRRSVPPLALRAEAGSARTPSPLPIAKTVDGSYGRRQTRNQEVVVMRRLAVVVPVLILALVAGAAVVVLADTGGGRTAVSCMDTRWRTTAVSTSSTSW